MARIKRGGRFVKVPKGSRIVITTKRGRARARIVSDKKDTVEVGGQRFSVRPEEQAKFVEQQQAAAKPTPTPTVKTTTTPPRIETPKPRPVAAPMTIRDIPQPEVQPAQQPESRLERAEQFFQRRRDILATQRARGETPGVATEFLGGIGAGIGTSLIGTLRFAGKAAVDPLGTTFETGKGIFSVSKRFLTGERFPEVGRTLKDEPGYVGGILATEAVTAKGVGLLASKASRVGTTVATRLDPGYVPVQKSGKIKLRTGEEIQVVGAWQNFRESLTTQARRVGQEVQPVSAARDLFTNVLQRKKVVDKPKPSPTSPELERTFFADPEGRLRPSRLFAKESRASAVDILSGDFQIGRQRAQGIVFEKQRAGDLPKDIKQRLLTGKQLTGSQAKRLEKIQLTPTGEFKAPGFLSTEPEIVLGVGETIQRGSRLGVTLIDGKRVSIIRGKVVKGAKAIPDIDTKAGKKAFESQTGFRSSDILPSRPIVSRAGVTGASFSIFGTTGRFLDSSRVGRGGTGRISSPFSGPPSGSPSSPISGPPSGPPSSPFRSPPPRRPSSPISGPPSSPPYSPPFTPRPPTPPPFKFDFKPKKPKDFTQPRVTRQISQRDVFTPSLTGVQFGFREAKTPTRLLGGFGPGIRGVVEPEKKKKKRVIPRFF